MKNKIELSDAELLYYPDFLDPEVADEYFERLLSFDEWRHQKIKLFGKEIFQPRLTAFFGETDKSYTYSGLKMVPRAFPEELIEIKKKCENYTEESFNVCLANLYRNGDDSMGWHSDDEKELGPNPVIASVSLGAERMFHLRHKKNKTDKYKIRLQHGSLLIMKGVTQQFWKHQLPKTRKVDKPRINLTFRKIY